jgi:hypothetical protein
VREAVEHRYTAPPTKAPIDKRPPFDKEEIAVEALQAISAVFIRTSFLETSSEKLFQDA